ncbi:3-ketoacyl-CoA synthase 4 [Coccomyxa sp. Obi]|nr:3-ketoacyl-CoA synthase 4 [Coccomyxa sp. Obi]
MPDETRAKLLGAGKTLLRFSLSKGPALALLPVAAWTARKAMDMHDSGEFERLWQRAQTSEYTFSLWHALCLQAAVVAIVALFFYLLRPGKGGTYLVDFYCLRPPNRMQCSRADMSEGIRIPENGYSEQSIQFMDKVMEISGLGDQTFLPDEVQKGKYQKVKASMAGAREETETALNVSIQHVLDRTGLKPHQIDGLIVNCSAFNPTPSLSAAVVNHFKFKSSIRTFNLSGMGCAASVIGVDLAMEMLANNRNMRILIAGTENILMNLYNGNQRSMLITNCIFRLGGVALLLSNHPADRRRAKYKLTHMVRTHLGGVDEAYNAVIQKEDDEGKVGVKIGKELMKVAGMALKVNITRLGPKVLPISEQLIFAGNFVVRKVFGMNLKPYVPDFTTAFEHFCIHPGGKAVIEEVSKQLKLRPEQSLPMLVPFERYGNTSSSSTWYAWSYVETFQGVKRGDRVWQLAFGSGFKCCSAVWVALRKNDEKHDAWMDVESY